MSSGAEFDQNTMEIEVFFVAALGLMVGSFLNVCISRIPRGESIVFPGSHCPSCGTAVKPYDNIPILSFLLLRGKCRSCRHFTQQCEAFLHLHQLLQSCQLGQITH